MREAALWDVDPFGSLPHARFLKVAATPPELRSRTVLEDNCAWPHLQNLACPDSSATTLVNP
jgi:hypothetical protein